MFLNASDARMYYSSGRFRRSFLVKEGKKWMFLYCAVLGTIQSDLHFTPWQTCSFQRHLDFNGKHSAILHILCEDYSFAYPPLCVARYSSTADVNLAKMWLRGVNEIAKASSWQQEDPAVLTAAPPYQLVTARINTLMCTVINACCEERCKYEPVII